jgi:hypothetical protein
VHSFVVKYPEIGHESGRDELVLIVKSKLGGYALCSRYHGPYKCDRVLTFDTHRT